MKDGRLNKCSQCTVRDVARWRKDNPGCRSVEHARARKKNGWMTAEEYNRVSKDGSQGRRAIVEKYRAKRRARTKDVSELTEFAFEEAQALASEREQITGFKWHVDHIVPLHHKNACGLHVAANFQVVPALWNISKGNRSMSEYI